MVSRTNIWIIIIVLGVYAALGAPQIRSCLANGGNVGSCVITGLFVGALKTAFYLVMALISGLMHILYG